VRLLSEVSSHKSNAARIEISEPIASGGYAAPRMGQHALVHVRQDFQLVHIRRGSAPQRVQALALDAGKRGNRLTAVNDFARQGGNPEKPPFPHAGSSLPCAMGPGVPRQNFAFRPAG
jgi:hypothetical protein